jgi:hypothetical protein
VLSNGGSQIGMRALGRPKFSHPSISFIERTGGLLNITPGFETVIEPLSVGEEFVRIEFGNEQLIFRVRVHQDFKDLWFGNDSITMFEGEDNYFLSAFAKFDDGAGNTSIGECSMHRGINISGYSHLYPFDTKPYITFATDDTSKIFIDPLGRIKALEQTTSPSKIELYANYKNDAHAAVEVSAAGPLTSSMIHLMDSGSLYNPLDPPEVKIFGGSGSGATAEAVVNNSTGALDAINIIDGGSGYLSNEILQIVIYRRNVDDAKAIATVSGSVVTGFNIVSGGANYIEAPEVRIVGGGGSGAEAIAVLTGGVVTAISVTSPGSGYNSAPQVFLKKKDQLVEVTVLESLETIQQPILKRIHNGNATIEKRALLFIGEGFSNDVDFYGVTSEVVQNLFSSPIYRPFEYIKEYIDIYAVNLFSTSNGITCANRLYDSGTAIKNGTTNSPTPWNEGVPAPKYPSDMISRTVSGNFYSLDDLIAIVGIPYHNIPASLSSAQTTWSTLYPGLFDPLKLDGPLFDAWKTIDAAIIPQIKDTIVGHCLGAQQTGERYSKTIQNQPLAFGTWYWESGTRNSVIDAKRKSSDGNEAFKQRLLLSLKFGTNTADPNYNISESWTKFGKNNGLVAFLLNDTKYAGTQSGNSFAGSLGSLSNFSILQRSNYPYKYDTFPDHLNSSDTGRDLIAATRVIAHEMGHSDIFELRDEYEDIDGKGIPLTNFDDLNLVDLGPNTTTLRRVEWSGGASGDKKMDPSLIKWNWHRVELSSMLIGTATNLSGNKVSVPINQSEALDWLRIKDEGREVILRTAEINPHQYKDKVITFGDEFPLTIDSVDTISGILVITGGQIQPNDFKLGSHIYVPLRVPSSISDIVVVNSGDGYTKTPKIEVQGDGKKGKIKIKALVTGGLDISQIEITNPGYGYTTPPKLVVIPRGKDVPGTPAVLKAEIEPVDQGVLFIRVKSGGLYDTAPNINIIGGLPGGGTPAGLDQASAVAHLTQHPTLLSFNLISGGSNYLPVLELKITGGGGTGAKAKAHIFNGSVNSVTVLESGIGYTSQPTLTLPGGTTLASFTANVTQNGWIKSIDVVSGGSGYSEPQDVYLDISHTGGGKGARARAELYSGSNNLLTGTITNIIVDQPGYGYTNTGLTATVLGITNENYSAGTLTGTFDSNGGIHSLNWTPPGSNPQYILQDFPLKVVVTDLDGTDMGAIIEPTIDSSGQVIDLEILYPGDGYATGVPPFKIEFWGGRTIGLSTNTLASATPIIHKQVRSIEITNKGQGYLSVPQVQLTGGTGPGGGTAAAELEIYARLIELPVFKHLNGENNGNRVAFENKTMGQCGFADNDVGNPDGNIDQLKYPLYRPYLVGIYEGGGTWNCEAYRPTGSSTMRNGIRQRIYTDPISGVQSILTEHHRFNYPCRYYIVSKIAPSQLARVDTDMRIEYNSFQ